MVQGILHGVSLSPFVRKVRAALELKSIAYELVSVMPGAMDPEFLARNPLSKVPVWQEGDWNLPDSSVICAYLERVAPSPALYDADARRYATQLFWEEYADTRLVEAALPVFVQRIVQARFFKAPIDESIIRRHLEEVLPPVLEQLETLFIGRDRAAESGSTPTIADLAVWSPLVNLLHGGGEVDASLYPGLSAFLEEMNAQPALRELIEEDRKLLGAD